MTPLDEALEALAVLSKELVDFLLGPQGEDEPEESDEIRALREEYGELLLAEQAKVESLEAELERVKRGHELAVAAQDEAYRQLRIVNNTLQGAFAAYQALHRALYGVS